MRVRKFQISSNEELLQTNVIDKDGGNCAKEIMT